MTQQLRRERDRAERERRIVAAARELAEAEGWDAVTTRRLAAKIEYSQPVLYSHFSGKGAIMAAAAVEGFAELAERLGVDERTVRRYVEHLLD
ncbi:TetR family transcriptional regulator, partial [Amycolatopsis samaneae]|uniref:TetR family transcriptional regulator n=1 Tax=Amycolatopsis samaneae TaxID=664691 RepID=UPI00362138D6